MMHSSNRILVDGKPLYMYGANYPWMMKNGKSNYGLDFGVNAWGTHEGVSTNRERVESDFYEMERLGFNTVRWFVFTDGRGGIVFDENGIPLSPAEKFYDDMDLALTIASSHNIKIIFVLLDFMWMHDVPASDSPSKKNHSGILKSDGGQGALIENVFTPIFQRYANHPGVLAWEVMNEPDWVVNELDVDRTKVNEPISLGHFKKFVRMVADAVHAYSQSKVTVGGGRIKYLEVWDDDELMLDFLQVHTYNDFLNLKWDGTLFGEDFLELNLHRPLLIGEFTTNGKAAFEDAVDYVKIPLDDYLSFCYRKGYAGSLFWSFNSVDKCGTEDRVVLMEWAKAQTLIA